MTSRVDPDYDASEEDIERIVHRAMAARPFVYHERNGNGVVSRWMMGIMAVLVSAGVVGLITVEYSVVQRLSVLETKVDLLLVRK